MIRKNPVLRNAISACLAGGMLTGIPAVAQELEEVIREITEMAYPDMDMEAQDRLARQYFQNAIPEREIRDAIFRASPQTLDQSVQIALETESYLKAEAQRTGKYVAKYGRRVRDD